jgi:diguanylate cyclase (GGDEF)-like protein
LTTTEKKLSDVLSEFASTMLTDFPIQGILDQLVRRIVEVMPITGAGVTLISDTTSPHYATASDDAALHYEKLQTELNEGPCIVSYRTGEAVAIADLREEERFPLFAPRALEAGLVALFTFPLRQGEKRLGALDLYRNTPGPLSEESMTVAQTLADVAAAYLLNAQARADLADAFARTRATSLHDPLTGLPNRILLLERIEHALLCRRRSGKTVAVLFIDLDKFKGVNDSAGHQAGDDLLVAVGARIKAILRPGDTLARLSGDEFIIVCHELNDEGLVQGIAERLSDAVALPFSMGGLTVDLSASIGVAFAEQGDDPEQLLHKADMAMYQVKRKGGAHHQLLDVLEQDLTDYKESLQRDLRYATQRGELRLEYQPVVRVGDGRVLCVEALLRWDHPQRGLISPAVLIPLAEQSGDIIEIGRWVLEQACANRHRWASAAGDVDFVMGVNVSAHQLMAPGFVAMVESVIAHSRTRAEHLCLEVTESAFVQDAELALTVLSQLKQIGILVALDDFGTGYSSLSYLRQFPFDIIKIDQSFVADLVDEGTSHAIVSKAIELAQLLDLLVVCEGVETPEQLHQVSKLGSDYCQGYLLARPMTPEMLDEAIGESTAPWVLTG